MPIPFLRIRLSSAPVAVLLPWILLSCCGETRLLEDAQPRAAAVLFVLDKSGGMAGNTIGHAKAACLAGVTEMKGENYAGILAFDAFPRWVAGFATTREANPFEQQLGRLFADGGTLIYPALVEALRGFQTDPRAKAATRKHIVLISDGVTPPAAHEGILRKLVQEGVTVTTICLGNLGQFDAPLMSNISGWGRGRFLFTSTSKDLARLVTREIRHVLAE